MRRGQNKQNPVVDSLPLGGLGLFISVIIAIIGGIALLVYVVWKRLK